MTFWETLFHCDVLSILLANYSPPSFLFWHFPYSSGCGEALLVSKISILFVLQNGCCLHQQLHACFPTAIHEDLFLLHTLRYNFRKAKMHNLSVSIHPFALNVV